jgi:hypothetical protein
MEKAGGDSATGHILMAGVRRFFGRFATAAAAPHVVGVLFIIHVTIYTVLSP